MSQFDFQPAHSPSTDDETAVHGLYQTLINGWNDRNVADMIRAFAADGEMIGFDGSLYTGLADITANLSDIFDHHQTPPFVTKILSVRRLGNDTAVLRAIAGMVPPGKTELAPELNAHQILVAVKHSDGWHIALFQNTPAQFHGRPELVEQMTAELRQLL